MAGFLTLYITFLLYFSSFGVFVAKASYHSPSSTPYTSDLELEIPEPSSYNLGTEFNSKSIPDISALSDKRKQDKAAKHWARWLGKNRNRREARWNAALADFEALKSDGKWTNYPLLRKLNNVFGQKHQLSEEKKIPNYEVTYIDEKEIINVSGSQFMKSTTAQVELDKKRLTEVNAKLSCDTYNDICRGMLLRLQPSIKSVLEDIMQYLVAYMAADYPGAMSYPSLLTIDIRLESPADRRRGATSSRLIHRDPSISDHRTITIHLPWLNKLARSYPEEAVWREIMGTITHEVTHMFQGYTQRLEAQKQPGFIQFNSRLAVWPFASPSILNDNNVQVPASAPKEFLEGIADYVALRSGLEKAHWKRPTSSRDLPSKWNEGTYQRAFFFEWLEMRVGVGTVGRLMGSSLELGYSAGHLETGSPCGLEFGTWETVTGMDVNDLWDEYGQFLDIVRPIKPFWSWAQIYFVFFLMSISYLFFRDVKLDWNIKSNQWIVKWKESVLSLAKWTFDTIKKRALDWNFQSVSLFFKKTDT